MKKIKKTSLLGILTILAIIAIAIFFYINSQEDNMQHISYTQFIELAQSGNIEQVILSENAKIQFYTIDNGYLQTTNNPRNPALKESLLMLGINVVEDTSISAFGIIQSSISFIVLGFIFFMAYRVMNKSKGAGAMVLNAVATENNTPQIGFEQVAGNNEAKESVQDMVDFIKNPEKYSKYGARMPRGIIFYGSPGTGKTLMAKAIAGEAGVPFFAVSGSDFVQMYVGVGANRVRELFKKAREKGKAVIFIDEIDAIGKARTSGANGSNDERDQTLNALLVEMSGFSSSEGIVVIAATNRLDTLDEALLRPGRFDRQIEIGLPDLNGRKDILKTHMANKPIADSISIDNLAKNTVYFSGAMLENLLNEAAINAAKNASKEITQKDIDVAYYTVIAGSEKKDRSQIKQKDREITAYHEAGHALATKLLQPENSVTKITIIPSTKGAGGFCVNVAPDKMYYTKAELKAQMISLLAGRAAEEVVFGQDNITTGASNDIQRVNAIIEDYITKYGMSTTAGIAKISEADKYKEYATHINELYNNTLKLVEENRNILENIAQALLEKESLNESELDNIMTA